MPPSGDGWERLEAELKRATLGTYDIVGRLGAGGMAAVFLAHHIPLNRKVAIKVMAPGLLQVPGMVDRFLSEARTIAQFRSESIVRVFEVVQDGDLNYFVMEYIRGAGLDQLIKWHGAMPFDLVQAVLYDVANGLTYAHRLGVIAAEVHHRRHRGYVRVDAGERAEKAWEEIRLSARRFDSDSGAGQQRGADFMDSGPRHITRHYKAEDSR